VNISKNIIITIFCLLFVTTTPSYSQSVKDSLSFSHVKYRTDIFKTSLEKRLNTYNFRSSLKYSLNSDKFFFGIDENYFSSLLSTSQKNIKDEQAISLIGEYKLSPLLHFGVLTQNSIYSNDRKIAINEASNIYSTIFTKITPMDQLKIIPYGGYSINKQVNEDDRGAIYGGNITLDRYNFSDFQVSSKIKFQNEDISPRKNSHQIASILVKNNLDLTLTNLLTANYSNTRKDFYFDTDSVTSALYNISKNIQSRTEKKYFIEERIFNSRFLSDLFFDLSGRVSLRDIDRETKFKNLSNIGVSSFDTQIEEFRLEFSGTTEYRSELFFGKIRLDYSERDEKHTAKNIEETNQILFDQRAEQEKKKNNNSEYTTISALGNFVLTKKDNISFSILHRKLVYNTPSEDNFDDRDELLSIMRLSYVRNFNHLFNFFVNLEGSYNHIVYIYGERSSNNNVRRIIKLNSGGEFDGSHIYSKNTFEVSANYTSYDFADINPNTRSFSFRQFSAKDSTSFKLLGNVYTDFTGYVKLSEQGNFDWKNFANSPDRFLAEYYLEPMINVRKDNLKMGIGLRVFSLQTFGYNINNEKYLTNEYSSIGPITNFSLQLPNVNLYLYGWYEFITNENNKRRELANLTLSVNWKL
jgi:hypothetical protein